MRREYRRGGLGKDALGSDEPIVTQHRYRFCKEVFNQKGPPPGASDRDGGEMGVGLEIGFMYGCHPPERFEEFFDVMTSMRRREGGGGELGNWGTGDRDMCLDNLICRTRLSPSLCVTISTGQW